MSGHGNRKKAETNSRLTSTDFELFSELLFTFLPFLISFVIQAYKKEFSQIIIKPEWSLAAAILAGQTIVKFILGVMHSIRDNRVLNKGFMALIITMLMVFLLAPSLVILTLIEVSMTNNNRPAAWLSVAQVALFIISSFSFIFLGRLRETLLDMYTELSKDSAGDENNV